jgi:hypothetical protein
MYKDKELKMSIIVFVNVWRKNIFDIYVTEYGTALTNILPILFLYLNTATVTTGTFDVNVKNIFTSHIDKNNYWHF